MLVLGIDPGTATTGYGLVRQTENGELHAIAYGVITTPPGTPMPSRLDSLYQDLTALIHLHRPDAAAVEELFFQKNVRTAITVAQGRGVVLLACAQNQVPVDEYTPLEIKNTVAGYGGADKKQMQQMVRMLLNLEDIPRPDDAADALATAICHIQHAQSRRWLAGQDG